MAAAIALSLRGAGRTAPNPNVGCVIVNAGRVVGRGWTQPGGRPHAEAMALMDAGRAARGASAFVTLEPCAHISPRGPTCADTLIEAGVARVVIATQDPDPRTDGAGIARLRAAGLVVETDVLGPQARAAMAGYFMQAQRRRPFITLKLALSLDGCIARADGESQWITGDVARRHAHLLRATQDMILVGAGTLRDDAPQLSVRLAGLEQRSPQRAVLTSGPAPMGWTRLGAPDDVHALPAIHALLIEGGAHAAAAFLRSDLVDQLVLYRAPLIIGGGRRGIEDIGLAALAAAHDRWQLQATHRLGKDTLDIYARTRGG